jgi:hypothetical protein
MVLLSKVKNGFLQLSLSKKIQLITALVLTLAIVIAAPTFAWFRYQRSIVKFFKIDKPNPLFLSAAHREDSINFEIDGIVIDEILVDGEGQPIRDGEDKEQKITYKDYVFCVTGEAIRSFIIQIAYTTNNPFTYHVYAAKELSEKPVISPGVPVDFVEYTLTGEPQEGVPVLSGAIYHSDASEGDVLYYQIDNTVEEADGVIDSNGMYPGTYLNSTDGSLADNDTNGSSGTYLILGYGEYGNIQQDARPVYWQARNVASTPGEHNANKEPFCRHFILRIGWADGTIDTKSKETDIVYISVKALS